MLGVFGQQSLISDAADFLRSLGAPSETVNSVTGALEEAQEKRSTAVTALVLVTAVLVFLGGALSEFVFDKIGLGSTTADIWRYARWPAALLAMVLIYAVVYFAAPNVEVRRWQWITPGAAFGVVAWLLTTAAFFLYVSNFGSYSATYGTFAAAVILLVWLWLTNLVLLFGAELNAVIDLRRSPELPESYDGPPLPAKEPAGG